MRAPELGRRHVAAQAVAAAMLLGLAAASGSSASTSVGPRAGQGVSITQESGCSFALSATDANLPAEGGDDAVGVTAAPACDWSATSDPVATWLRITAGARGNGDGKVDFVVDFNPGPPRSTTLVIAGHAR